MLPPASSEPTHAAIADLYRACHLPAPMVVVARDAMHFARLARAWSRSGSSGPLFLTGMLGFLLATSSLSLSHSAAAIFGTMMAAYLPLAVVPVFLLSSRLERGVRERVWWSLRHTGFAAIAGALALWLDGRGWWEAFPVMAAAMGFAASGLVVSELLAPMRLRRALGAEARCTSGQAGMWTRFRGAVPIGPTISNRLRPALAEVAAIAPGNYAQARLDIISDGQRRVLWDALWRQWLQLYISRDAEPLLGSAGASSYHDIGVEVAVLRLSGMDPATLPQLVQAAVKLDALAAAVSTFDGVAVLLPAGASPLHTPRPAKAGSWRRSMRAPWNAALHWLEEPSPTAALIDVAPTRGFADWVLARRLMQVQEPTQRTPALQALGIDRAAAALRLRPVQEDASGKLFHFGPREAPSVFLFVRDRVVDQDGLALTHWLSVPPHMATAQEAVRVDVRHERGELRPGARDVGATD